MSKLLQTHDLKYTGSRMQTEAQKRATTENMQIFRLRGHIALCKNFAQQYTDLDGIDEKSYLNRLRHEIRKIKEAQLQRKRDKIHPYTLHGEVSS